MGQGPGFWIRPTACPSPSPTMGWSSACRTWGATSSSSRSSLEPWASGPGSPPRSCSDSLAATRPWPAPWLWLASPSWPTCWSHKVQPGQQEGRLRGCRPGRLLACPLHCTPSSLFPSPGPEDGQGPLCPGSAQGHYCHSPTSPPSIFLGTLRLRETKPGARDPSAASDRARPGPDFKPEAKSAVGRRVREAEGGSK